MSEHMRSESIDVDSLNEMWRDRCCIFVVEGRRRVGIFEQCHHGTNMITVRTSDEVFEVPRQNVYL